MFLIYITSNDKNNNYINSTMFYPYTIYSIHKVYN